LQNSKQFVKPQKRRALTNIQASGGIFLAPFFIAALMIPSLLFESVIPEFTLNGVLYLTLVSVVLVCVIALISHYVPERPARVVEPPAEADCSVRIEDGSLLRIVDGLVVSSIDATRDFEYAIIERYSLESALFELYQGESTLQFRISDPGGEEAVTKVLQIKWPPPRVSAGRSG